MKVFLVLLLAFATYRPVDSFARLPSSIDGVMLGWRTQRAIKHIKKKRWRSTSDQKKRCGRDVMFRNRKGDVLSLHSFRGRIVQVSKILGPGRAKRFSASGWQRWLERKNRKYGKPKVKVIPMGKVLVIFCRWSNKNRNYSIDGNATRSRPRVVKMMMYNLKDRRGTRASKRCRGK